MLLFFLLFKSRIAFDWLLLIAVNLNDNYKTKQKDILQSEKKIIPNRLF